MNWINDVSGNMEQYSYNRLDQTSIKWNLNLELQGPDQLVKNDFPNNGCEVAFPGLEDDDAQEMPQSSSSKWTQCELFSVEGWDKIKLDVVVQLHLFKTGGDLESILTTSLDIAKPNLLLIIESSSSRFKETYISDWSNLKNNILGQNNEIKFSVSLPKSKLAKTVKVYPLICLGENISGANFNNAQQKGQILAEGQIFKLEIDQPKVSGIGALRIEWVDFSTHNTLKECSDALYHLTLGDDPYLKLNSHHDSLKKLLDSSTASGKKKDLRVSYFNTIAANITFDMIHWAVCEKNYIPQADSEGDDSEYNAGASKLINDLIKFAKKPKVNNGLGLNDNLLNSLVGDLSNGQIVWIEQQKIKSIIQQYFITGKTISIASKNLIP